MYIVPFHSEEKPCIEKYENVKIVQEIHSADEAVKALYLNSVHWLGQSTRQPRLLTVTVSKNI